MAKDAKGRVTPPQKEESVRVRISSAEKAAWEAAAKKDGRTLSGWLRNLAAREVQKVARETPKGRMALRLVK